MGAGDSGDLVRRGDSSFLRRLSYTGAVKIERFLGPIIAGVVIVIAITTLVLLGAVHSQSETVGRLDVSTEVSNCRSRFANEREAVRAELEASSAAMSAGLAEGLTLVVDENADPDDIEAIKDDLPIFVSDVRESADDLIDAVAAYEDILELPEDEFLSECRKRFP